MKAADTNVLLRFLTFDDHRQGEKAAEAFAAGMYLPHGVLMEAEWVLRIGYEWSRERINAAFTDLLHIQSVAVDQLDALMWALDRHLAGADWADMLHLIASEGHSAFVTFDRALEKSAGAEPPLPVELLK